MTPALGVCSWEGYCAGVMEFVQIKEMSVSFKKHFSVDLFMDFGGRMVLGIKV